MVLRYEARILRVLEHIHDNPAGDLSLDALADVAAMSRFHWHRVFHAMTGETCARAVRRIRLHRAACWLVQRDWTIGEVAARAGYPNVQSFTRAFKAEFACTPGVFRKGGEPGARPVTLRKGTGEMYEVEIVNAPERVLAAMAHKGSYFEIGKAFEKLRALVAARQLWPVVRGAAGVYHDDPAAVPEAELRSHAGLILAEGAELPEGLERVILPAGRTAVLHFTGPYAGLPAAYEYLYGTWLPASGEEPRDAPVWEDYLNSPADVPPEELLTDICLPLR